MKLPLHLHIGDTLNVCHLQRYYGKFELKNATPTMDESTPSTSSGLIDVKVGETEYYKAQDHPK